MSKEFLKQLDRDCIELASGDGSILVSPGLQGRVFAAAADGTLYHKLDRELALHPVAGAFNNLGGNSLWPAPEGGDFAYNYPPNGAWYVQEGINSQNPAVRKHDVAGVTLGKEITLLNRKGVPVRLDMYREVTPYNVEKLAARYGLKGCAYQTREGFQALDSLTRSEALIAAWSLEQFYLTPGAVAFGVTEKGAEDCLNLDFYGDPRPRLKFGKDFFTFRLGGEDRQQIGVKVSAAPSLLGAYLPERNLLLLRVTSIQEEGVYFNIADNDQVHGAYSAADVYSVFNGATLGFFELETIAPMREDRSGRILGSELVSRSYFFEGGFESLDRLLTENHHFSLNNTGWKS